MYEMKLELPEDFEQLGQGDMSVSNLQEGTVFQHKVGLGIRVYDGVIDLPNESGAHRADDFSAYSMDELEDDPFDEVIVRDDLRACIKVEKAS